MLERRCVVTWFSAIQKHVFGVKIKRTKNTRIFSSVCEIIILFGAKFCIHQVDHKKKPKRGEKKLARLFFEVFFAFLIFHHRFVFFLSLRPRARILSSFHARATERERLREEFEVFFDSFYLY